MQLKYRSDIDGLRAIAIIVVVAYHAGVPFLQGGFIGVDIFFVISGFLITGILAKEVDKTDKLSWTRFYARRARRLLPALTLVLVVSLLVGIKVLIPDPELRQLGQSLTATSLFIANVFFQITTSGYFTNTSDAQPLLNMWSLSVVEQFYIIWPAVLLIAHLIGRRILATIFRR